AYSLINPAATGRQVQALTAQLFTLATTKASATAQPQINKRARLREATNASTRAS
ncbi:MAG: transposase, partial [Mycolicibacterium mageritense]